MNVTASVGRPLEKRRLLLRRIELERPPKKGGEVILQADPSGAARVLAHVYDAVFAFVEDDLATARQTMSAVPRELGEVELPLPSRAAFRACVARVRNGVNNGDPTETASACSGLSDLVENAEPRNLEAAELLATVAAALRPESAELSWKMGRIQRTRGSGSAAYWYNTAIEIGIQHRDWLPVARSWLGLSHLMHDRGQWYACKGLAERALRLARVHKLSAVLPEARHHMAVACFKLGKPDEGFANAHRAFEEYGARLSNIAMLANDVVWHLYLEPEDYAPALPLLRMASRHTSQPFHRLVVLSSLARAAACSGNITEAIWAMDNAFKLEVEVPRLQGVAEAMADVEKGAMCAGLTEYADRARAAASRARQDRPPRARPRTKTPEVETDAVAASTNRSRTKVYIPIEIMSPRMLRALRSGKLDGPLKGLVDDLSRSEEVVAVAIDCGSDDTEAVAGLVEKLNGILDGIATTLRGTRVHAALRIGRIREVVDSPLTQFVSIPLHLRLS